VTPASEAPQPARPGPRRRGRLAVALAASALSGLLTYHLLAAQSGAWVLVGAAALAMNLTLLVQAWPAGKVSRVVEAPAEVAVQGPEPDAARALLKALRERQLALRYRPQRRLPAGVPVALQVQAGWGHPTRGLLQGDALVGFAQAHGLGDALLDATLSQACEQLEGWRRRTPMTVPPLLALTVPTAQARGEDLPGRTRRILRQQGWPAARLRLLWPWTALDAPVAAALASDGVGLALCGIGASGSSLGALLDWPLRAVVLDAGLVGRVGAGGPARMVAESTVRLAASMQIATLADGVDTPALAVALAELGCEAGQGEALGPWLDAAAWARRWAESTGIAVA
jgi:EAL domain-containing protein (putative c-di-GMP-specific phosphodiesterase class I)